MYAPFPPPAGLGDGEVPVDEREAIKHQIAADLIEATAIEAAILDAAKPENNTPDAEARAVAEAEALSGEAVQTEAELRAEQEQIAVLDSAIAQRNAQVMAARETLARLKGQVAPATLSGYSRVSF